MNPNEIKPIRSFTLSDLPLLRRLAPQGASLDILTGLTRGVNPINEAFLAALPLGDRGMPTYVLRDGASSLCGLLRHREGAPQAYIAYLSPDLEDGADPIRWLSLIEGLVKAAGARGAHILNAEVNPNSATFVALREAGFVIFTRQEIWRREAAPVDVSGGDTRFSVRTSQDDASLTTLYVNIVPRLVQQAIPPPEADKHGLLYRNAEGHAAGYFIVHEGQRGCLLRPLFHPEIYEQASGLIADALTHLARPDQMPVYCAVPSYQEWLHEPLAAVGFEPWASQVVMGKYTVRRIKDPVFQLLPVNPLAILDVLEQSPPPVPETNAALHFEPTNNKKRR